MPLARCGSPVLVRSMQVVSMIALDSPNQMDLHDWKKYSCYFRRGGFSTHRIPRSYRHPRSKPAATKVTAGRKFMVSVFENWFCLLHKRLFPIEHLSPIRRQPHLYSISNAESSTLFWCKTFHEILSSKKFDLVLTVFFRLL